MPAQEAAKLVRLARCVSRLPGVRVPEQTNGAEIASSTRVLQQTWKEYIFFLFSFANSRKAKVCCGDLESARLHGRPDVPNASLAAATIRSHRTHDRLLARVSVFGAQDEGRGFLEKFSRILIDGRVRQTCVLKAACILTVENWRG